MDVREIIKFRQMARKYADLCQPQLFKTGFSLRPQRDDMVRLAKACLVPEVAKGIKQLTVFMGDMSLDQFMAGINVARYVSVPDKPLVPIQRLFNTDSVHCKKDIMEAIFSQLPNLTSITMTSYTSPFWQEHEDMKPSNGKDKTRMHFEAIWEHMEESSSDFDRSHFLDSEKSVERYTSVLLATLKLPSPLRRLVMDPFPIDCFSRDMSHLTAYDSAVLPADVGLNQRNFDQMKLAVANVEELEIGLIGSGDPTTLYSGANLGKALGKFIGSMKHLKSLSLDWMVEEDVNEEFAKGWDKTSFGLHFEKLEDLRFANIESPRDVVASFILRHKDTLKRLHWSIPDVDEDELFPTGDDTEPRTWRAVFTDFKEQIPNLQCCELLDDSDPSTLYLKNWELEPRSPFKRVTAPHLLEMFVQGKLPWPMKRDNPHHYKGWQPKYPCSYDQFAAHSAEELADLFSEEWETDREDEESSTDEDDDEDTTDDDDDDDEDMSDEGEYTMDIDGEGDEWEDEDEEDEHFGDMPNLIGENGLVWGNVPPEMLMALLAANAFQPDMDMDVDVD